MTSAIDVARAVVRIPRDFDARGDVSFHGLLLESGYKDHHAAVDVRMIESALRSHPEFVSDWLQYSEGKRSSAGWYFRKVTSGVWEVGYVGAGAIERTSSYGDAVAACAAFVKNELDAIGGVAG